MIETFTALLTAHLLADFVVQTDAMVRAKKAWGGMALHIASVVALSALALGSADPVILAVILVTHLAMDLVKTHRLGDTLQAFTYDQAFHLVVIAGLSIAIPDAIRQGLWGDWPAPVQQVIFASLAGLSGLIVAVPMGGIVIGKLMDPIAQKLADTPKGLENGGRYIGWLERGLAFVFFLNGQPEGVALLLAAKSILRFGDIAQTKERAHTEYVIIGTMLSFGWALVTAILAQKAIAHWQ